MVLLKRLLEMKNKSRNDKTSLAFVMEDIRDFKIQRRGRQQERQKKKWFNKQNNNFARASRFFVHFFARFARPRRENA